jgi:hypothetical protein
MKEHYLFEFVTIFFIVIAVLYNKKVKELSFTTLGKLLAVLLIIFYTIYDTIAGLLMCGLIILYYQCSFFEGFETELKEAFESKNNANANTNANESLTPSLRSQFEIQYCDKGKLKYKNNDVKTEMAVHVFPELNFNGEKCNPCSSDCDYSVIEEKILERFQNEENLIKPKDSNGWF